jgi:cytochrome P450
VEVLERTIFSDGFGRDPDEVRAAMSYFDTVGRIDPFDILGLLSVVPRPTRMKLKLTLRFFEKTVDDIIAMRQQRIPPTLHAIFSRCYWRRAIRRLALRLATLRFDANILTFIAAGQEATANCITWTLYLLSQSREWRERVRAEADREFDGSLEGLADRLPVTRAVIDETNRLYPPITAISRIALGPDELAGESIKPGTMVVIAFYVLHRHRALWAKPNHFDPSPFPWR